MTPEEVYQYLDPLHPCPYLRDGYQRKPKEESSRGLKEKESLITWWKRHDKTASFFSSDLTQSLVKKITDIDESNIDVDALKALYRQADEWLLLKAHTNTSRYQQVLALRNEAYAQVLAHSSESLPVVKKQLAVLNRHAIHKTKYFQHHWQYVSSQASFFKTEATCDLDAAFAMHARDVQTKERDQVLLSAINTWIEEKKNSTSKRFQAVLAIKAHLEEVIASYEEGVDNETRASLSSGN